MKTPSHLTQTKGFSTGSGAGTSVFTPKFRDAKTLDEALVMLARRKPRRDKGVPRRVVKMPTFGSMEE